MKYVIFDTETGRMYDDVIQLSYIVLDDNFSIIDFKSFHTLIDNLIHPDAFNVHHISNEMLDDLSKGLRLEDYLLNSPHKELFFGKDVVLLGYNVNYDIKSVANSLAPIGVEMPIIKNVKSLRGLLPNAMYSLDLMQHFKAKHNLRNGFKLTDAIKTTLRDLPKDFDLDEFYNDLCSKFNVVPTSLGFHDASYDVVCTYLVMLGLHDRLFN